MKRQLDPFLLGLVGAVALAWLAPEPGARGGWLHPEVSNKAGVALIFFLHGAGLSFAALKAGTLRWPLHLVVQTTTFLLFPAIGLVIWWLAAGRVAEDLRLGFFFLCAAPSTISSSVAMTAAARGNVAAAVFNATLSSVIGIFATPLWIGLLLRTGGASVPLGPVILDLIVWLLLPLGAGQLCRRWLGPVLARHRWAVHVVDRGTILFLVYTSFCDSMKWGVWSQHGIGPVGLTLVAGAFLFFVVLACVDAVSRARGFTEEDRIAAVFCGSKKSLASGVPMAQLIFAGHPGLSLILLPLMIYHSFQLFICGWLAGRWARRGDVRA